MEEMNNIIEIREDVRNYILSEIKLSLSRLTTASTNTMCARALCKVSESMATPFILSSPILGNFMLSTIVT